MAFQEMEKGYKPPAEAGLVDWLRRAVMEAVYGSIEYVNNYLFFSIFSIYFRRNISEISINSLEL